MRIRPSRTASRTASRAASLATGLAAVAGAVLALADPAGAAGVNYVALGDSYSSGVGASSSYLNSCDQSTSAYPYLYQSAVKPASFGFEACGGATTTDVLNNQLGPLNSATTLVSMTIGGNDVGFSTVMEDCVLGSDSTCLNAINSAENTTRTQLPAWLDATYSAIRSHAPSAHVVILGYPHFYDLANSSSCVGLDTTKRTALDQGADLLNSTIQTEVAKYANFTWESVASRFAGHELCDSTPWLHSLTWPIGSSYHPTAAGQSGAYLPALEAGL